jgi:hypothetical protein
MDNSFDTYILIFLISTFSLMSVEVEYLDDLRDVSKVESSNDVHVTNSLIKFKYQINTPLQSHTNFENFNMANLLENETEIFSSDLHSSPLINNFRYCMTSTYNIYTVGIMRIEFLDIFSPPPNS